MTFDSIACLCFKDGSAKLKGTASIRAKSKVSPGQLRAKLSGIAKLQSPPEQFDINGLKISSVLGSGPRYTVSITGSPYTQQVEVNDTATIDHYESGILISTFTYTVYQVIDSETFTLEYVDDTGMLGDIPIYDLCSVASGTCCQIVTFNHVGETTPPRATRLRVSGAKLKGTASISARGSVKDVNFRVSLKGTANINAFSKLDFYQDQKLKAIGTIRPIYADKFAGEYKEFDCEQKLYPIRDINTGALVNPSGTQESLFSYVDEGTFVGNYHLNGGDGYLISDDKASFIQPSSINTEGLFEYQCEVTAPIVNPKDSMFRIRASAPLQTLTAKSPKYTIENILFEDPSGNLIAKYNNIEFFGDANHFDPNFVNFTTYSTSPLINKGALYDWQHGFPIVGEASGYSLSFNIKVEQIDDPFNSGFDIGFEEYYTINYSGDPNSYLSYAGNSYSSQEDGFNYLNPTIKISAIEICLSGGLGPRVEQYVPIYTEVRATGHRIERCFYPTVFPLYNYDTGIWPSVSSVWIGNDDPSISNETLNGTSQLLANIKNIDTDSYVTLDSMGPIADSGKLTLRFGHSPFDRFAEVTPGAFHYGFDESIFGKWTTPSGAYNTLNVESFLHQDGFFVVETISLKVLAKHADYSRPYVLDIVGYSDDCLLNVTSAVRGFLQNVSGIGSVPISSGFAQIDDLALDGEVISDKSSYYEMSEYNDGGDHYSLVQSPLVSGTEFKWYEIPLKVYDDNVELGRSRDYNMSSLFERLYLDIYPIPSGASIASIQLCVRYKPQNALTLIADGGPCRKISDGRSEGSFYPTARGEVDNIINAGSGFAPISRIEDIPHGYGTPTTLKSNYSRRWRGVEGTTNGPFDPDMFGFGFENPTLEYPFLSGFYNFDIINGTTVAPVVGNLTGTIVTNLTDYKFTNLGWRFTSGSLFEDHLPGYSGSYLTTDWTSLNSGINTFQNHELYGQIADAFKNVVRISGHNSYINFGDIDIVPASGFAAHIRFSPDANVSGASYNLFNSGVLLSKWESGNDLEFLLGYSGGYLVGMAKDGGGTIYQASDTMPYSGYQYPLSVILTYNDNNSNSLRLYTDNEFESNWTTLRDSTSSFTLATGNSSFMVGNCTGSGVGMNMFVSEIGISNSGNIVYSNPDATLQQVTAQKFFENNRMYWWDDNEPHTNDAYKLWDYVDENTYLGWQIGDFKFCEFSPAFSIMQVRTGRDLINFTINHHGSGYSQYTDIAIPSSINPDVAYHSQIENDFLRFNLSDADEDFRSTFKRITKDLPRGYDFAEKALVVETVLEHHSDSNNIIWEDGNVGPKLIVSLYTPSKDPYYETEQSNWGLVNRDFHYLEPSSCFIRVDSVFDYQSICDTSEAWAVFPNETRLTEFTEKYFATDIDKMFVQYDLVYPSGPSFDSHINIHSAHVRAENAWVCPSELTNTLNLSTSGGYVEDEILNLTVSGALLGIGELNLYTSGQLPTEILDSGFNLYTFGVLGISSGTMPLFTENKEIILDSGLLLQVIGDGRTPTSSSGDFNLTTHGHDTVSGIFPLTILNTDTTNIPDTTYIPLFMYASDSGVDAAIRDFNNLFIKNDYPSDPGPVLENLNLRIRGTRNLYDRFKSGSLNLFITPQPLVSGQLNLTLYADNYDTILSSGNVNLYTANYIGIGTPYYFWFNNNYGTDIEIDDEIYASLNANDEIRGVDLYGYGSCTGDSPKKAIDAAVITDDTVWREETCNEGGIFRATNTYTNIDAGYSGNYYGIRKYINLLTNAPYYSTLKIITGTTESIPTPRNWEEWEYGMCGPDWYESGCCTFDCDQNLNYSGGKLIGDYPYLSGDLSLTPVSGRLENDNYGYSVAIKQDLMAVGAPFHKVPDESGYMIDDAGAVFLYRREEDVAGKKANWYLEDKLLLPDGYRRDYNKKTVENLICYPNNQVKEFCVSGQKWAIGQQGREMGHSVDIAYSGGRETVVVGAPGAAWNRTFEDIVVSGIPAAMIIFTDKFDYSSKKISAIASVARKYDILYKYFSAPWNLGFGEWQPSLGVKILVCQIYNSEDIDSLPKVTPREPWFNHLYINNLLDKNRNRQELLNEAVSGIKSKFNELFPYDTNLIYNNIPPIMGIFGDNTPSTNETEAFRDALNGFVDYFQDYAFASGVENLVDNTPESGHIKQMFDDGFSWDTASKEIIELTLSTGNLIANDSLHHITSGVGQEWARATSYEFQIPPESGGRVYIFENEGGRFNLIQELISPDEEPPQTDEEIEEQIGYGDKPVDRFGHSVSISNNGDIISVGSPYSKEACRIYERDDSETDRMYAGLSGWLTYTAKTTYETRYAELHAQSGASIAQQTVYIELSQADKFALRIDELYWGLAGTIQPYKKVYKFHYSDIPYIGTWSFIPQEFAGTSRLGYSTSVSEDGTTVLFGAPTDSFNEFDDINVWYEGEDTWASYTNAGAVRVFESRKYYPHNKVVEFYKFGNLDRSAHPDYAASGFYDQMGLYFQPDNIPFEKTAFSEIEIPTDAGLAFIITPELDAASDEIIDNIKTWLSLGDRTLVLVGNDPVWEENGLYKDSNELINKILTKLGSRMKIVPARNEYEALNGGVSLEDYENNKYNITRAHVPAYSHNTHVLNNNIFASGVGDIKIDLSDLGLQTLLIHSPCDDINTRCEIPIKHFGDVRSEWNSECIVVGDPPGKVEYKTNFPFHFGNTNPAQICSFYPENPKPYIVRPDEDIRPILTAAEYIKGATITIPPASGEEEECTTIKVGETIIESNTSYTSYSFAEQQVDQLEFSIQENEASIITGYFDDFSRGQFFDPTATDGRDGFLQASGYSYGVPPIVKTRVVSPESVWATEEAYFNGVIETTSQVVMMASPLAETAWSLGLSLSTFLNPNNNDQNIYFYNNLVMKDCNNKGNIVQLGGWTGRNSFTDAFEDSRLASVLRNNDHTVSSGVNYNGSDIIPSNVNVVWVANPTGVPLASDINRIKNWMNLGNKKLVITYSNSQQIASNIEHICNELNLNSKPYFLDNSYYVQNSEAIANGNVVNCCPYGNPEEAIQKIDSSSIVFAGCSNGYSWNNINNNTKVDKLAIIPTDADSNSYAVYDSESYAYIPILVGANTKKLVYYNDPITERYNESKPDYWRIDAESSIGFDVQEGSGYRMFINWVSETPQEKFDIRAITNGVSFSPAPDEDFSEEDGSRTLIKTPLYTPQTTTVDFRVPSGVTSFTLGFNTNQWRQIRGTDFNSLTPLTPRVLSVSGCLLPIESTTYITNRRIVRPIYDTICSGVPWFVPGRTIERPDEFRPISTLNTKYCGDAIICEGFDNKYIEDGPVVVADELEHFSSFTNGRSRSRIVLITDSTIIQGKAPYYRNDALSENQEFIRSLYPTSPENFFDFSDEELIGNGARRFEHVQKLRAPDRGSPAKLFAASGIYGLVDRFGFAGSNGGLTKYTDQEDTYVPGDVFRRFTPIKKSERDLEIDNFGSTVVGMYGVYPRFSGEYNGETYVDAGIGGGIPRYMQETGYDYINFDVLDSGYVGDMFGFSVDMHNDKIVVGAPFNGFLGSPTWSGIITNSGDVNSGILVSHNGGAGAAYCFENTGRGVNAVSEFLPWEFKQKIKPDSINIGSSDSISGDASYTDRFGHSVTIDADFIAVGAPAHDFETIHEHIYSGTIDPNGLNTAFLRKDFSPEFDIPTHNFYDLGSSGTREIFAGSGKQVTNNGAVFTFRHELTDWANRTQEWIFAEKLYAQGFSDRNTQLSEVSGCENDFFGYSVAIDRPRRGDADYSLIAGAPGHNFPTSGNHITLEVDNAGSAYTFDAMLRKQVPAIPNSGSYIDAQVFGDKPDNKIDRLTNRVYQNTTGNPIEYAVSGLVFSNDEGEIFLEVSGFDPATRGFVAHRPYVELVIGELVGGIPTSGGLSLLTSGKPVEIENDVNLSILGAPTAIVYNTMNLNTTAWNQLDDSLFTLHTSGQIPLPASGMMNINMSGVGLSTEQLNLRTRGK